MAGVLVGVGYVDVRPDLSQFGRQLRGEVTRDISAVGREAAASLRKSLTGALSGVAAGFGFAKLGGFVSDAVQAASDLNEAASKSAAVFDSAAPGIAKWAKGAADNLGLSQRMALETASTFGNMFVQLGFGVDQAAAMSRQIIELGVDFRSFTNADISSVLDAQSAAFRGEYDSLQRFLPLMSAATIQQHALAITGKTNADQLTAQDRALATYDLMLKGAGDAAGDFQRTHESLANQLERTRAAQEDSAASIGEALIPLQKEWSKILREEVIPALTDLFSTQGDVDSWAAHVQDAVGDTVGFLAGAIQQTLRAMANLLHGLPTGFGEKEAEEMRVAADSLDGFRDKMHASKEEMQRWAGGSKEAGAAQAALAGSTRDAAAAAGESLNPTKEAAEAARDRAKASRDAAAAERDLADARGDLARLLAEGAVDEEKVADARERLDEATRSLASANRSLSRAQEGYNDAQAAFLALPTDTNADKLRDATDSLADAQDGVASAAARQKDAQDELAEAQRGDPEYQDKLADARDRVADAQDRVADTATKVAQNTPAMTGALTGATTAVKGLDTAIQALKPNMEWLTGGGLLGVHGGPTVTAGAPTPVYDLPAFGVPGTPSPSPVPADPPIFGPPAPAPKAAQHNTFNMTFNEQADPMLVGHAIAWQIR